MKERRKGRPGCRSYNRYTFLINQDLVGFHIPMAGFGRAHFGAQRLFTVLAGNWQIEASLIQLQDPDPGAGRATGSVMKDGAYHFTGAAAGALLRVDS